MSDGERRPVRGWEGRFLEDFAVGDVYEHGHGRTISEADNTWFSLLTNNPTTFTPTRTTPRERSSAGPWS